MSREDFHEFDIILAMDRSNLADLQALAPASARARLALFLEYGDGGVLEVPDPYYGGSDGFAKVLDLVEGACDGLIAQLRSGDHASR